MIGGTHAQQRYPEPSSARLCRRRTSPQPAQGPRGLAHCSQAARAVPGHRHCRSFPQTVHMWGLRRIGTKFHVRRQAPFYASCLET